MKGGAWRRNRSALSCGEGEARPMRACAAPGPAARRAALAGPERWRCRQCGSGLRTRDVNDREVMMRWSGRG